MTITIEQLESIMPNLRHDKALDYINPLIAAMAEFSVNSPAREAAFLAQVGHESCQLRWMEEIWGPSAAQLRYEPPGRLADRLGNTEKGDGYRYKGRGPIQLTGRAEYREAGTALGLDLEGSPESAADPSVAFRIAAWYWSKHSLNGLVDSGDFREITRRINGGYNGEADREALWAVAKKVLGV